VWGGGGTVCMLGGGMHSYIVGHTGAPAKFEPCVGGGGSLCVCVCGSLSMCVCVFPIVITTISILVMFY
jgi:hypothetical protein